MKNTCTQFFMVAFLFSLFFIPAYAQNITYVGEGGFFGGQSQITIPEIADYSGRNANSPGFTPLVGDLNKDGNNNIIVVEGNYISVYNYSVVSGLRKQNDIQATAGDFSKLTQPVLIDIDDDGYLEIAIYDSYLYGASEGGYMRFFNFSSDYTLTEEYTLPDTVGILQDNDNYLNTVSLACNDELNICASTGTEDNFVNDGMQFFLWNRSDLIDTYKVSTVNEKHCVPLLSTGTITQMNLDDNLEYAFGFYTLTSGGVVTTRYMVLSVNTTEISLINTGSIDGFTSGDTDCDDSSDDKLYMTSPLVGDIDGSPSSKEFVIPSVTDVDNFRLYVYKPDGTYVSQHPAIYESNGQIMGMPFFADFFDDTDADDVCALGYEYDEKTMELVCFSKKTGYTPSTRSFFYDVPENKLFNLSTTRKDYSAMGSSMYSYVYLVDGHDLSEFLTPYGLMYVPDPYANIASIILGLGDIEPVFEYDFDSFSANVPVDYNDDGYSDIISITDTNIWYIDDGYVNIGCGDQNCIRKITTNPDISYKWKVNTTFETRVTVSDTDGDTVRARVFLYYDEANEQASNWTPYASSGSTLTFSDFSVNQTGIHTLRIEAEDFENIGSKDIREITFSVGNDGIVFGEYVGVIEYDDGLTEDNVNATDLSDPQLVNQNDNFIKNTMDALGISGNLGYTASWFLLMIVFPIAFIMYCANSGEHIGKHHMMVVAILEVAMTILGTYLGFLNLYIVVTMTILAIAIIGLWLKNSFSSGG